MKIQPFSSFMTLLLIIVTGFSAGLLNSLVGGGGGIVVIFALTGLYAGSPGYSTRDIFAMSLLTMLPMSVFSSLMYIVTRDIPLRELLLFSLPALAGGCAGALLLDKLKLVIIKKIFAALVIFAGLSMLFR